MQKPFCVIAPNAVSRTWLETEEQAVAHGAELVGAKKDGIVMYVVKVVKVVRLAHPPIETVDPDKIA